MKKYKLIALIAISVVGTQVAFATYLEGYSSNPKTKTTRSGNCTTDPQGGYNGTCSITTVTTFDCIVTPASTCTMTPSKSETVHTECTSLSC